MQTMPMWPKPPMHKEVFWRQRITAAFRTAWACFLVGLVLQLGNMHVQWAAFPIFGYVMAVTIVGESTFGKGLQDTVGVLVGTIQGIGMGMLLLHVLGVERMTLGMAVMCISISSFIIAYPQTTLIISKRIALAHSAILYITASIKKGDMEIVYFPLQLAGTTMVGATCGMLALLMPCPHLAMFQVLSQVKLSTRIASERLQVMVDAFCTSDAKRKSSLKLQARSLAKIESTIGADIISKEIDMGWELSGFPRCSKNLKHIIEGLKILNLNLLGMELSLKLDSGSQSKQLLNCMLKDCLVYLTDWVYLALQYASISARKGSCRVLVIIDEGYEVLSLLNEELSNALAKMGYMALGHRVTDILGNSIRDGLWSDLEVANIGKNNFECASAALSFLFYMEKFLKDTQEILTHLGMQSQDNSKEEEKFQNCSKDKQLHKNIHVHVVSELASTQHTACNACVHCTKMSDISHEEKQQADLKFTHVLSSVHLLFKVDPVQLKAAFKMSLAMAIGAFLGSWFSRSKGYWADITLALGYTGVSKGGSFKTANLRAQGTVAGSIYGLLVILATKDFPCLRLICLIPWVVLMSFLRHSKLYEYSGALSAFTGAIVILARTNKDSTDQDFTLVRIVEAFLGMASFIIVELLILPTWACSMVKDELLLALYGLKDFTVNALPVYSGSYCQNCENNVIFELKKKLKSLRSLLSRGSVLIKEAAEEPQFWFSSFPTSSFSKLMDVQIQIMNALHYSLYAYEATTKVYGNMGVPVNELQRSFTPAMQILEVKLIPTLAYLSSAFQIGTSGGMRQVHVEKSGMVGGGVGLLQVEVKSTTVESLPVIPGRKLVELSLHDSENKAVSPHSRAETGSVRLMHFMEEFENDLYVVMGKVMRHHILACGELSSDLMINSLLLSLGALAVSLEGFQRETCELEKTIHELLQLETPWSLIDLQELSDSAKTVRI